MEINDLPELTLLEKIGTLPDENTPFKRPRKKRAIFSPPTFFIPRRRPPISPLKINHAQLKGKLF